MVVEIIPNFQITDQYLTLDRCVYLLIWGCFMIICVYMARINIYVRQKDLEEIDSKRGDISRSYFMVRASLGETKGSPPKEEPKRFNSEPEYCKHGTPRVLCLKGCKLS